MYLYCVTDINFKDKTEEFGLGWLVDTYFNAADNSLDASSLEKLDVLTAMDQTSAPNSNNRLQGYRLKFHICNK